MLCPDPVTLEFTQGKHWTLRFWLPIHQLYHWRVWTFWGKNLPGRPCVHSCRHCGVETQDLKPRKKFQMHNIWGLQGQEIREISFLVLPSLVMGTAGSQFLHVESGLTVLLKASLWWKSILHGGLVHRWDSARNRRKHTDTIILGAKKTKVSTEYNSALPWIPLQRKSLMCPAKVKLRGHTEGAFHLWGTLSL